MDDTKIENAGKEMVVYQPDNLQAIEVRVAEETVWLTQAQMTEFNEQHVQVVEQKLDICLEGSKCVTRDEVSGG